MIAGLKKINSFVRGAIHQAVFLGDTAGPTTREHISKRFGFAQALEWIAHDCLDQIQHSYGDAPVGLYPKSQIAQKLRLEDGDSLNFPSHRASRAADPLRLPASVSPAPRVGVPRASGVHF